MKKHMLKNNFFCLTYISNFLLKYKIQKRNKETKNNCSTYGNK